MGTAQSLVGGMTLLKSETHLDIGIIPKTVKACIVNVYYYDSAITNILDTMHYPELDFEVDYFF